MSGQKYRCSGTCRPWVLTGRVCIGYGEIIPRRLWQTGNLYPSDLRASLDVAVQSRMSMKIEAADILSADADGYAVMRIRIAGIPDNAVGLYLYYSFDQVSYEMAAWRGKDGEYTNYLEQNAASGQAYDYIVFKYNIGKRPIWFKNPAKGKRWDGVRTMTSGPVKCQVSLVPEADKAVV